MLKLNRPETWQDFERLCRDLLSRLYEDDHGDLNGRPGQAQGGIDVWVRDRRTGARVRVQCKDFEASGSLDETLIRELVAEMEAAPRPPDRYVILTSAPNHAPNKALAEELSRPGFEVQVHGWDWISARVEDHLDLVRRYRLAKIVTVGGSGRASAVAGEIGRRFTEAIALMNEGRDDEDRLTLPTIAAHLGLDDWGRLEQIAAGEVQAPLSELNAIAEALGLSRAWLIEGKAAPFRTDDPAGYTEIDALHEKVVALKPETIWFVREDGEDGDVTLVLECDALRWFVWTTDFPCSEHVGATGRRQMLELCALIRRLDFGASADRIAVRGRHLEREEFWSIIAGERHPRSSLKWTRNDDWWEAFGRLDPSLVDPGDAPRLVQLRRAIDITRGEVKGLHRKAKGPPRWRDFLAWGMFGRLDRD